MICPKCDRDVFDWDRKCKCSCHHLGYDWKKENDKK